MAFVHIAHPGHQVQPSYTLVVPEQTSPARWEQLAQQIMQAIEQIADQQLIPAMDHHVQLLQPNQAAAAEQETPEWQSAGFNSEQAYNAFLETLGAMFVEQQAPAEPVLPDWLAFGFDSELEYMQHLTDLYGGDNAPVAQPFEAAPAVAQEMPEWQAFGFESELAYLQHLTNLYGGDDAVQDPVAAAPVQQAQGPVGETGEPIICPITQDTPEDPVLAPDGNIYDREAITHWLNQNPTSPVTREPMFIHQLQSININAPVAQAIEAAPVVQQVPDWQAFGFNNELAYLQHLADIYGGNDAMPDPVAAAPVQQAQAPVGETGEPIICPITQDTPEDPVLAPDGNIYDREAITQWLNQNPTSPVTREPMFVHQLQPITLNQN